MTEKNNNLDEKYNQLKQTEAHLIQNLTQVIKDPTKEKSLAKEIFQDHQAWLKLIMPNYNRQIHEQIIMMYENDSSQKNYYDAKAGQGATDILIRSVKQYLN